ncbi:MAG: two-component sensor histidine kinase [Desulfobacterales bacterium]|nr:two-component sensor histidine kinase [Desulfobacterales bacterium]MBF0395801.1 two-component sensor histidine kinase [Desulfobacterales bacterium]
MKNKQYYGSLNRNMIMIMIVVSLVPLILISSIIGYYFETSYREKVFAHLKELVQKHQQNIDNFLYEKLSYLKVLENSYPFDQLTDESFLTQKLYTLQQAYNGVFVDLGIVNNEGIQIAYAGNYKLTKADYSKSHWFKKAIEQSYFISDVFLGLRNQPHFIITVKHNGKDGHFILRATIDFELFNALVEKISIGETGSAFIINRNGELQTKLQIQPMPDKNYFMNFLSKIKLDNNNDNRNEISDEYNTQINRNNSNIIMGNIDYSGNNFIYVITSIKNGEWVLVYQQAKKDALYSLYHARNLAIIIFLIGGLGIVAMAVIISKRVVNHIERTDKEKEIMNDQIIEAGKLVSIGELAAGIAHEINNPIAIMMEEGGWIDDLMAEEEFSNIENFQEIKRALNQIRVQGERCKEITHKLLSFARKTDPIGKTVELNDLIEEIVSILEQRSKLSNIKMIKNLAPDLPEIFASPSEIQQVFLNLINNAMDAMGSHGGNIEITSKREGDHVIVDVSDTGSGIPKAIMARIFDPFFTTKPVGKGTGLGLSICFGIIKKMGGDITVSSTVGVGTTFHIYFPVPESEKENEIKNNIENNKEVL